MCLSFVIYVASLCVIYGVYAASKSVQECGAVGSVPSNARCFLLFVLSGFDRDTIRSTLSLADEKPLRLDAEKTAIAIGW